MGAMIGFFVGYMLGTREGERGREEIREAWRTIRSSDEARDLVMRGVATAKYLLSQGVSVFNEGMTSSDSSPLHVLRPTG